MSLSVNCVVKPGWILERMARELVAAIPGVAMNETGYLPAGPSRHRIHYFLPMKDVRHVPDVGGITVGLFTHGMERAKLFVDSFDACVTMNRQMAEFLRECGARDVTHIWPGTEAPPRPLVFGVCGRVYGKGRKGAFLIEAAVADGFVFQACSEKLPRRWKAPCRITHRISQRAEFYRSIDYLVVPALDEGGPMPVLEAIAFGVPVIAPDVGFCWDLPVIRYQRGSWESLREVLVWLAKPPTWAGWVDGHRKLFERLMAKRVAA